MSRSEYITSIHKEGERQAGEEGRLVMVAI
jgi:hypothetical protein